MVAAFCYCNTLFNDFCDDGVPIVERNPKVNDAGQWSEIWTTDYWSDTKDATPNRDLLYRPVSLSSYRLVAFVDRAVRDPGDSAGPSPFFHLLLNVLLHALNSALVARLCRHMGGSDAAALVAGAVFATLPIHTEVINNVVGRADLLATLGVVGAILAHRRSMVRTTDWSIVQWRVVAGLAAFIAMGSKESGVAVIPAVILLDNYWYRPWRAASRDRPWWSRRSLFRFAYLIVPAAVYLALRYYALEGQLHQKPALTKTVNVLVDAPSWQHVLGVIQLWGMYWAKTVWPQILCVNYSINTIRLATSVFDPHVMLGIGVSIGLLIASVLAWRKGRRSVAYLSAAIVITYAATSNAWILIQVFFAERIWYLPSAGVAVLVGLAVLRLKWRPVWCLAGAAIVFVMTERCWQRNAEWKDNKTLYAATYEVHRRAVGALRLYGQSLVEQGQVERGIEFLKRAIDIDLGFVDAHRSLGQAYLLIEDYENALRHLQIANMQVPEHPPTVQALAFVSDKVCIQHDAEVQALRVEAEKNPLDAAAEVALIRKLVQLARTDEALARLRARQGQFGDSPGWQYEYAVTLVLLDRRDEAIARYARCLELAPTDVDLRVELASLLLERREGDDLDRAWELTARAMELAPEAPSVLGCRAELLALRGDLQAAGALYQRAIERLPPDSDAWRQFRERAAALGQ